MTNMMKFLRSINYISALDWNARSFKVNVFPVLNAASNGYILCIELYPFVSDTVMSNIYVKFKVFL